MIKLIQVGMGPVAQRVTKYISERPSLNLVGAVDIDPKIVGKDAGEHCGIKPIGVTITSDLSKLIQETQPEIAVVSTCSTVEGIENTLKEILSLGVNVDKYIELDI